MISALILLALSKLKFYMKAGIFISDRKTQKGYFRQKYSIIFILNSLKNSVTYWEKDLSLVSTV